MCQSTETLWQQFSNIKSAPIPSRVFVELVSGCSQRHLCDTPCPLAEETVRIAPEKLPRLIQLLKPLVPADGRIILHGDGNPTMYLFPTKLPHSCDVTIIPDERLQASSPVFNCKNLNVFCRVGFKTWPALSFRRDWIPQLSGFTVVLTNGLCRRIDEDDWITHKKCRPIEDFPDKPFLGLRIIDNLLCRMLAFGKSVKVTPESVDLKGEVEKYAGHASSFINDLVYGTAYVGLDEVLLHDKPMVGHPVIAGHLGGDIWYVRRCNNPKADVFAVDLTTPDELKKFLTETPLRCQELCPHKYHRRKVVPSWTVYFSGEKVARFIRNGYKLDDATMSCCNGDAWSGHFSSCDWLIMLRLSRWSAGESDAVIANPKTRPFDREIRGYFVDGAEQVRLKDAGNKRLKQLERQDAPR